jgi:hypothetical protein
MESFEANIIGVLLRHQCAALVQPIRKKKVLIANIEVIYRSS